MNKSMLLTAKDVARDYKIPKTRAYELMHSKGFPSIQLGARFYVRQEDIEKWLISQRGREFHLQRRI